MNAPKPPTPMLPTRGARLEIRAEGLTPEGDAFAHLGDVELRVPGLLPGERAEVLVTEGKARRGTRRARARLLELREPSPARREPACRHQRRCGGCPLMILDEAEQRAQKRAWLARLGLEVAELRHDDAATGYRWSAKRVVGGSAGALELGSWVRGSHELASMSGCLVDHPTLVAAASEITEVASRLAIEPYDEAKASGDLRYVWLKTDGERVLVTLVSASEKSRVRELAAALERPSGIAWSIQGTTGNAMRGSDAQLLRGDPTLTLTLAGERLEVGPLDFLQPNPHVAAMAYQALVGTTRGDLAWDLYAGTGFTTRLLRHRFTTVHACDARPGAGAALGIEATTTDAFLAQHHDESPTLVIANPPRAGLGPAVCQALAELPHPFELRIMSCHPEALARDVAHLTTHGFTLAHAEAFDTLPQTAHVEVVVAMSSAEAR